MRIIKLIAVVFILQITSSHAQELTETEKQNLMISLEHPNENIRIDVLEQITNYQVFEAENLLIEKILSDSLNIQYYYIEALASINSSVTEQYAVDYLERLDSAGSAKNWDNYLLGEKAKTSGILIELGHYTETYRIFKLIKFQKPNVSLIAHYMLRDVLENVPIYSDSAKIELIYATENSDLDWIRTSSLRDLDKYYGEEVLELIKNRYISDPLADVRSIIFHEMLKKYRTPELKMYLIDRLQIEQESMLRYDIYEEILKNYSTPEDYNYVSINSPQESDTSIINYINYDMKYFVPRNPDSTIITSEVLDTLISYNQQCFDFGWMSSDSIKTYSENQIDSVIVDYNANNIADAITRLTNYELWVIDAEGRNELELPAYKFLKYYAIYSRERMQ